jgi:hypothetical protein
MYRSLESGFTSLKDQITSQSRGILTSGGICEEIREEPSGGKPLINNSSVGAWLKRRQPGWLRTCETETARWCLNYIDSGSFHFFDRSLYVIGLEVNTTASV